jgi:hypothetical protein
MRVGVAVSLYDMNPNADDTFFTVRPSLAHENALKAPQLCHQ